MRGALRSQEEYSSCQPGRWTIRQDVGEAMKRIGALGLYLMAGLATSAAVAASASAAAPELGRCLAKLGGTYANSSCTTIRAGVTKYEWVPGPGPKNLFTFTTKTLQQGIDLEGRAKNGDKLICGNNGHGFGEYVSASEQLETVVLEACTGVSGLAGECTSAGDPQGEITTAQLRGLYGFIKRPGNAGISLEPASGTTFIGFECGGVPVIVRSSIIAPLTPRNKMTTTFEEKFKASGVKQNPTHFEFGAKDVLEASINSGPFEEAGATTTDLIKSQESLEFNTHI